MIRNDRQCDEEFDVVVIGGGFYGCCIAEFLALRAKKRVLLIEQHGDLLQRASYGNQARVHGGYHYPRSFLTARRSYSNLARFTEDFRDAVCDDFEQIYAIAANGSKVSAQQFQLFCKHIGAPLRSAGTHVAKLFDARMIEAAYSTDEVAFDAFRLKELMRDRLNAAGVTIRLQTVVTRLKSHDDGSITLECESSPSAIAGFAAGGGASPAQALQGLLAERAGSPAASIAARKVVNCTYAGINELLERSQLPLLPLKQELAEIALIEAPVPLRGLGITVMDGPFFSTMPFPAKNLHSLTHVRYTPHSERSAPTQRPGAATATATAVSNATESRVAYMMRDAARFLPIMSSVQHVSSIFEIKTILCNNEVDDGRPILFRGDYGGMKNLFVVMGGKMDNVYDVLEMFAGVDFNA
jgi:glycine/D-amino acid oxidase-like deaminating enzyme